MKLPYIIGPNTIVVSFVSGTKTVVKGHQNFDEITGLIKSGNITESHVHLFDKIGTINVKIKHAARENQKTISVDRKGRMIVSGTKLPPSKELIDRVLWCAESGVDYDPIVKFADRCLANPNELAIAELFNFIDNTKLPITEDGHFVAFKKIRSDFFDFYTGTIDNSPGRVVEMSRDKVNPDRRNTCADGLHFCSESYLGQYHSNEGIVVRLKIDPADVVSIPIDYNFSKGRTCRYVVLDVVGKTSDAVKMEHASAPLEEIKFDHSAIKDVAVRSRVNRAVSVLVSEMGCTTQNIKYRCRLTDAQYETVIKWIKRLYPGRYKVVKGAKVGEQSTHFFNKSE